MEKQSLEVIQLMTSYQKEKYWRRLRTAFNIRLDAELGDGYFLGLNDHAPETIQFKMESTLGGESTLFYVGKDEEYRVQVIDKAFLTSTVALEKIEYLDTWPLDLQILAYQQLVVSPFIERPEEFNTLSSIL
jgi:hypothetical protein